MNCVRKLTELDRTLASLAGGKGANLGELTRIDGISVPPGFCVTTEAYEHVVGAAVDGLLDRVNETDDPEALRALGAQIRTTIENLDLLQSIVDDVAAHLGDGPVAVRSSATAEDLAGASFAGQYDSYLDIVGLDDVLHVMKQCWASMFTERALLYRNRNSMGHKSISMAVVVQQMVPAQAAGVLFTADPVTSNRKVTRIDAVHGLGEALVSGRITPDVCTVRDGIVDAKHHEGQVLTEELIIELERLGRIVETHFGAPQDIEWCRDDTGFHIVQSRPITTLFPIPAADDDRNRVYVSVGHQQMMTDAMTPLGISVWQKTSPAAMRDAGSRLFVDVTDRMASLAAAAGLVQALGTSDPLIGDALQTVVDRGFVAQHPDPAESAPPAMPPTVEVEPGLVTEMIAHTEAAIEDLRRNLAQKTGAELLGAIGDHVPEMRRLVFDPRGLQVIGAGFDAAAWLDERLGTWLGEKRSIDVLTRSVPHNVTSDMGLALLDVADVLRRHPDTVEYLRQVEATGADDTEFLARLDDESCAALTAFLTRYGMRCPGEIDITRARWSENPTALVPMLVSNIDNFAAGAATERYEQGLREAHAEEADILARLRALPDGEAKAAETKTMIDRLRGATGYREYPKFALVNCYFAYKQALLGEAARLREEEVIDTPEDIYFLRFDELCDLVRTREPRRALIAQRRADFRTHTGLTAPRVLTSEGEALSGHYRRDDIPDGALTGLAVSAGTVEGRARVVTDLAAADLEPGDILVTAYTDPGWTPLFVTVAGVVTEVGGLMTHGAVIAREYGLPAVVGVEHATQLIADGQRIRVHGTDGYVEILDV